MLTTEEWETALLYLGVPNDNHIYLTLPILSSVYETQVRTHIATVVRVEETLAAIEADTVAKKVGDLEVNYAQQITYLRQQGTTALNGLSNILQIPIMYNRFNLTSPPARYGKPLMDNTRPFSF